MQRAVLALPALGLALIAGCPQQSGTGGNTTPSPELSSQEQAALDAALVGVRSLTDGAAVAGSTAAGAGQSAIDIPTSGSFGECPVVTIDTDGDASSQTLAISANFDFGSGCSPYGAENYTCSGSASGTLSQTGSGVNLSFDQLSCNGQSLSGSAAVSLDSSSVGVTVSGQFDLTYSGANGPVDIDGSGTCTHSPSTQVTTVDTFAGTVATGGSSWSAGMTSLEISYAQHRSFVPFAGTITLSAGTIRSITVRFNENSPVNGSIEVSIAGGDFAATTLDALFAANL